MNGLIFAIYGTYSESTCLKAGAQVNEQKLFFLLYDNCLIKLQ